VLRYVALLLLILLLALEVKLWTGEWSMREVWHKRQRVAEQKQENLKLKQRNEALSAEVQDLKNGSEAIEERARSELGLIKPGETFYQVVEPAPGDAKKDANDKH
jgi:cell division protein FtsB